MMNRSDWSRLSIGSIATFSNKGEIMTKEELKSVLKDFGSRGKEIAEELYEKLETEKAELDTETRRKVRAFWLPAGFILGVVVTLVAQWSL